MFGRRILLGISGAAALVSGMLVFMWGREFSGNWMRWVVGPLLWFLGCALLISWTAVAAYSQESDDAKRSADRETAKAARKVS